MPPRAQQRIFAESMSFGLRSLAALGSTVLLFACGGESLGPTVNATTAVLSFDNLRSLDPATEGSYEAWVVDRGGAPQSLGRFLSAPGVTLPLPSKISNDAQVWITIEPPGDADGVPSPEKLLRATLANGQGELTIVGALTQSGLPLQERPGQFTMFSPSDNAEHGYPSFEESGVWLFNMLPRSTEHGDMWVRLAQLDAGWTYEGWMVRDIDQPNAIWLSYGKFVPDYTGTVNSRDDTGWGAFSGVTNFRTLGEEEFPGDDWISNPLNLPFPKELTLPLDLRETNASGQQRWTHVITIEPASNRGEPIGSERPFVIRPYRDVFGMGAPGIARTITYRADGVPHGHAELR